MKEIPARLRGVSGHKTHGPAVGFLLLLTVLFFFDLIFLGRIWFDAPHLLRLYPWRPDYPFTVLDGLQKDFTGYFLPQYAFMVRSLFEDGILPLWNPYLLMGVPAFGDGMTKILSPLNGIHLFFDFPASLNVRVILQVFLCGVFMYGYLYSLISRRTPALMGAVAYMFSGFILGKTYTILVDGYYLAPLGLFLVDRAVRKTGFRPWIPVSLVLSGIVLGSFAPSALDPLLLLGAYAVFRIATRPMAGLADRGRCFLYLAVSILVAVLLAAVELLPFRAILAESTRFQPFLPSQEGVRLGLSLQMLARALLNFFFSVRLPLFFHMVARNWTFFGALSLFVLATGYLLGWRRGLQKHSALSAGPQAFFLGAILLGFFNYYFAPSVVEVLSPFLTTLPHVFSSVFNYRALFLVAIGFPVLLANGFHILYRSDAGQTGERLVLSAGVVTLGGAAAAAFLIGRGGTHWLENLTQTHQVWLSLGALGLVSSVHLVRYRGKTIRRWIGRAVLGLLFLELWVAGRTLFHAYPKSFLYPPTKVTGFLRDSQGPHRVVSFTGSWNDRVQMYQTPPTMNVLLPFQVRMLGGASVVAPRRTLKLLGVLKGETGAGRTPGMQ